MGNLYITDIVYGGVAADYIVLKKIIGKLHKSSSSAAFVKKPLFSNLVPTFAKVRGQYTDLRCQCRSIFLMGLSPRPKKFE